MAVVDGSGLRIRVDRGALVVEDGSGTQRRSRRFEKATHGLSRIVVLGSTGVVSLDALTWCRRLNVGVVILGPDGSATLASTPRLTDDARLRRMQSRAADLPVGLDLSRSLIAKKLRGQAELLRSRFDTQDPASVISDLADACQEAAGFESLRQLEASAAALYFQSWVGRPECVPSFAGKDRSRVPPHWGRYEGRRSVLQSANSNRKAERPANALLNYLYALLEVEAVLACNVVGLDPGLGLLHADVKSRASMALDLIEPIRPEVDRYVLDLLERRTFRKGHFMETPDGHCRLTAPLTHELAETLPRWAEAMGPIAEEVAHSLGMAMAGKYVAVTPLSQSNLKTAQAVIEGKKAVAKGTKKAGSKRQRASGSQVGPWLCPECGGPCRAHAACVVRAHGRRSQAHQELRGNGAPLSLLERGPSGSGMRPIPALSMTRVLQEGDLAGLGPCESDRDHGGGGISKGFSSVVRRGSMSRTCRRGRHSPDLLKSRKPKFKRAQKSLITLLNKQIECCLSVHCKHGVTKWRTKMKF